MSGTNAGRSSAGLWMIGGAALLMVGAVAAIALAPPSGGGSAGTVSQEAPPHATPEGMVWVGGGDFWMGSEEPADKTNPDRLRPDEFPRHRVQVTGFWMDTAEVTNAEFAEFVEATGYKTFAEKTPTREDLARSGLDMTLVPDKALVPNSLTFNTQFDREALNRDLPQWQYQVWQITPGADWRHPDGPGSSIENRMNHPVVHVNWEDANAYLEWAGKRLPTEAEYEYASRDGGKDLLYPWGNERDPGGTAMCNYWQGDFPLDNTNSDGFLTTSPVKSFKPNGLGLYDISGNVWEWCHDFFRADYYADSPRKNPKGPEDSLDPDEPGIIKRSQRGGSYLCNTNSCTGYRTTARMKGDFLTGTVHTGFRGVVDDAGYEKFVAAQAKIAERKKTK